MERLIHRFDPLLQGEQLPIQGRVVSNIHEVSRLRAEVYHAVQPDRCKGIVYEFLQNPSNGQNQRGVHLE
ncbi:MAG: hypothetical protein DCC55_29855 [Chloroflexi bacterium]|nr:MAG: hypothetical protein DCC55_29855 [Chloroflexota bacterium]